MSDPKNFYLCTHEPRTRARLLRDLTRPMARTLGVVWAVAGVSPAAACAAAYSAVIASMWRIGDAHLAADASTPRYRGKNFPREVLRHGGARPMVLYVALCVSVLIFYAQI